MRYARLMLVLALMAVGTPVMAGSGDTPGDPCILKVSGEFEFKWKDAISTPPNDVSYYLWAVYAPGDSVLLTSVLNVTELDPDRWYVYEGLGTNGLGGEPGDLTRVTVWMSDAASGMTDKCSKWFVKQVHHSGGCACRAR